MKRFGVFWLLLASALMAAVYMTACASGPAAEKATAAEEAPAVALAEPEPDGEATASKGNVSQELYDDTLADVRLFIENLNNIIRAKNYTAWKNTLSDEFFNQISSPDFLANASESAVLKTRRIVLKTPNDYFLQVVVPARSQSRADEIEFVDDRTVKVFHLEVVRKDNHTTATETRRLRLYELRRTGDTWKIID